MELALASPARASERGTLKLISGGQSGVDRAALDVALAHGLPCGGWCPSGRLSEDGPIPAEYPLWETRSREYHVRTQRNVETSSATLVITRGTPTGGTRLTVEIANSMRRPLFVADVGEREPDELGLAVASWLRETRPSVLNVAGPRESGSPGIGEDATRLLEVALRAARYLDRSDTD